MISKIEALVLGDVHLGHPNTSTQHIVNVLRAVFGGTPKNEDLNWIIFEGDVFDRLLQLPANEVHVLRSWIHDFLKWVKQRNIRVDILEGTPSHDWKQSEEFLTINRMSGIEADVHYHTQLSIVRIDRFDIDVLFVPDEWRSSAEETWSEVTHLLTRHGLDSVDVAVMHGMFPHQIPKLAGRVDVHDPEKYLSIVRRCVFIGHVHQASQMDRIYAAGSLDRLAHGEEKAKGYYRVELRNNEVDRIKFVENRLAKRYVTVDCTGLDTETGDAKIQRLLRDLPPQSFIRIKCKRDDAGVSLYWKYSQQQPTHRWSILEVGKKQQSDDFVLTDNRADLIRSTITPANVRELLLQRVRDKRPDLAGRCEYLLEDVLS